MFIILLVQFGLLSGHLLGNSCPLGKQFVLIVFCLFVIFIYFPFWFRERDLPFDCSCSCSLLFFYFYYIYYTYSIHLQCMPKIDDLSNIKEIEE